MGNGGAGAGYLFKIGDACSKGAKLLGRQLVVGSIPTVSIKYGITGNYYAVSKDKNQLIDLCRKIGKSPNSIGWSEKFGTWVFRVKNRTHKNRLKNDYSCRNR